MPHVILLLFLLLELIILDYTSAILYSLFVVGTFVPYFADFVHFSQEFLQCFCLSYLNIWSTSWQNQQNGMCTQQGLRSAGVSAQSDQSLRCLQE